jgi:DsbC/DsbD-like thiol-disulfide interchange protein
VTRYLRLEAAIVTFWRRPQLATLHGWAASSLCPDVQLVIGEGGAGKTRLALQLAQELREQPGWRSYWVPAGDEASAAAIACQGEIPVLLILDYARG